jgi:hypothetical protein
MCRSRTHGMSPSTRIPIGRPRHMPARRRWPCPSRRRCRSWECRSPVSRRTAGEVRSKKLEASVSV